MLQDFYSALSMFQTQGLLMRCPPPLPCTLGTLQGSLLSIPEVGRPADHPSAEDGARDVAGQGDWGSRGLQPEPLAPTCGSLTHPREVALSNYLLFLCYGPSCVLHSDSFSVHDMGPKLIMVLLKNLQHGS